MKTYKFFFVVLVACFTFIPNTHSGEYPGISKELAEVAVLDEARQVYGLVKVFDVTTYYDLEGEPEVYCFTLYRKTDELLTLDELKEKIANAKEKKLSLQRSLKESEHQARKNIKKQISEIQKHGILNTASFITAFAGAHEGHVPVIKMQGGLPPHLTHIDDAKQMASDHSKQSHLHLRRVIYFGMFDIRFEFEDSAEVEALSDKTKVPGEDNNPTVDPYRKKVLSIGDLRKEVDESETRAKVVPSKRLQQNKVRGDRLKEKWDHVKRLRNELTLENADISVQKESADGRRELRTEPSYSERVLRKHSDSQ